MRAVQRALHTTMSLVRRTSGLDPLDIDSWNSYVKTLHLENGISNGENINAKGKLDFVEPPMELNDKVALWQGDITEFQSDCIVNAANKSLLGGGGVDGAIHRKAGSELKAECSKLHGCDTGLAKITKGYKLPAKNVIHTVGPIGAKPEKLRSCYWNCLELMKEHELRTIVFPCISTGIYGYPQDEACQVAVQTVRSWLETNDNASLVDRIIFCVFEDSDFDLYENTLPLYFPPQ